MKKLLLFILLFPMACLHAQDGPLTSKLKQKYASVTYHQNHNGWYLVSYVDAGRTMYAFVDHNGNIVQQHAIEYKTYPGYISMNVVDRDLENSHKQWERDMLQYNRDNSVYEANEAAYKRELEAYNRAVDEATRVGKQYFQSAWESNYNTAYNYYLQEARNNANQRGNQNSGGLVGAILGAVATGLDYGLVATKAKNYANEQTKSESLYINEEKNRRKLSYPPTKKANPKPVKPVEPKNALSWVNVPYLQPCPYKYIDYNAIQKSGSYADVMSNGKYGLVDAKLRSVLSCTESEPVKQGKVAGLCRVGYKGKKGLLNDNGSFVMPLEFESISETTSPNYIYAVKKGKTGIYTAKGKVVYPCQYETLKYNQLDGTAIVLATEYNQYGVLDFETKAPILPYKFSNIENFAVGGYTFLLTSINSNGQTKCGLYAKDGTLILPVEYATITTEKVDDQTFLRAKRLDGTIDLVDRFGIHQIPQGVYESYIWESPFFHVKKQNKYGLVCFGKELIPCEYNTKLTRISGHEFFLAENGMGQRLLDYDGNVVMTLPAQTSLKKCEADHVTFWDHKTGKYGALNYQGQVIVPSRVKYKDAHKIPAKVAMYAKKKKNDLFADNQPALQKANKALGHFSALRKEELARRSTFSFYAREYVERVINDWQRRGEFEDSKAYQQRVNERTRSEKVRALTKEAERLFIAKEMPNLQLNLRLEDSFDPTNMVYRIQDSKFGSLLIPIPTMDEARYFKANWENRETVPSFFIDNDMVALKELGIKMPNGKTYMYKNTQALNYEVADVDYNFGRIEIATGPKMSSLKSVTIVNELNEMENVQVLASYNKDFRSERISGKEDPFPYALFRVHLKGQASAVKAAKENLKLYLGQSYVTQVTNVNYPNMILYLVPKGARYATLQGGDGCQEVPVMQRRILESNKIYDMTIDVL